MFNSKNIINSISIILCIIAILLSWSAYNISKETRDIILKQMRPKVLLVDATRGGISHYLGQENSHNYLCDKVILLQNVGGLPTSLTKYETIISLHSKSIQFSSNLYETLSYSKDELPPALSSFRSAIFINPAETVADTLNGDFSGALKLPFQIEAYSSITLLLTTSYILDWNENPFDTTLDNKNTLTISYKIHFASGQIIETPPNICQFIKG